MRERRDNYYTIVTDQDLHDRQFFLAYYHGNHHLDITVPLARHDHRTLHLGQWQCRQWALKVLELSERMALSDPKLPLDYAI